jgi:hypothetical protein
MCTSLAGCRVSGSRIGLLGTVGTVGTGTVGSGSGFSSLSKTRNVNLVKTVRIGALDVDVTRRSVVAHNHHSYARFKSDAYSEVSCGVPYNLSEVSYCFFFWANFVSWFVEIVIADLTFVP